ncbi:hypothetical protein JTE90_010247 [Oedothorax gibbosus]|uniref:Uncharacterized protein n=1 Tax=Oedothorax gibbosus TaxID=931172 RepID=A0AAV6TM51_9ARAC|nr:hypothetical protein JTE90_010247 [Oedothorax gibbosus]
MDTCRSYTCYSGRQRLIIRVRVSSSRIGECFTESSAFRMAEDHRIRYHEASCPRITSLCSCRYNGFPN